MRDLPPGQGTVVVTGSSSGRGRASALRLARAGYHVFAGVRGQDAADELRRAAPGTLTPLQLEITDPDQIRASVKEVTEATSGRGITGLVNAAGVGWTFPSELVPMEEVRQQFEINVFGPLAVTQAFLPQLRRGHGRLVNIGSIGDRLTMPFGGPLNATKHAAASFNDALRIELRPWGIHVALIEPASIRTPSVDKLLRAGEEAIAGFSPRDRLLYEAAYRSMLKRVTMHPRRFGTAPEAVAAAVHHAMAADRPRTRYLVGKSARPLAAIARFVPDRGFDALRERVFGLPRGFGARANEDAPG
jgi:NAD(P)-dependent dehydrogenase (short-subunit alcohol dehydrogenase family)